MIPMNLANLFMWFSFYETSSINKALNYDITVYRTISSQTQEAIIGFIDCCEKEANKQSPKDIWPPFYTYIDDFAFEQKYKTQCVEYYVEN